MINLYKDISEEILKLLEDSDINTTELINKLKKRQDLIDSLNEDKLEKLKKDYNENKIYNIDKAIKAKLSIEIIATKKEINSFKVNKTANSAYANMNKNNLNIFYKKV